MNKLMNGGGELSVKRYDFIYFYKNFFNQWIPLSVGHTNDLSLVLWKKDNVKEDLQRAGCKPSKKVFIYIDGRVFLVKDYPFDSKSFRQ